MLDSIANKTRRRLVVAGMMSCLFVAGLAFATFENGPGSSEVSSAGFPQDDKSTAAVDPRNDPDDCLYEPPVPKAMAAVPGTPGEAGSTQAKSPSVVKSTDSSGDDETGPAVKPNRPSSDSPDGSPSDDATDDSTDDDGTTPSMPPHKRDSESSCPGR